MLVVYHVYLSPEVIFHEVVDIIKSLIQKIDLMLVAGLERKSDFRWT